MHRCQAALAAALVEMEREPLELLDKVLLAVQKLVLQVLVQAVAVRVQLVKLSVAHLEVLEALVFAQLLTALVFFMRVEVAVAFIPNSALPD
jgi:hypothetical protein